MKWTSLIPLLFVGVLLLTGCSSTPSWLEGTWTLNVNRSITETKKYPDPSASQNPLSGMGLAFLPLLSGLEITITSKDITTTVNGQEKWVSYSVMETSDSECKLKVSDGTVQTYYRDGDAIYSFSSGGFRIRTYFDRKK